MTAAEAKANVLALKLSQDKSRREKIINLITQLSKGGCWQVTYYSTYAYTLRTEGVEDRIWEPMDTKWIESLGFKVEGECDSRYVIISWGP